MATTACVHSGLPDVATTLIPTPERRYRSGRPRRYPYAAPRSPWRRSRLYLYHTPP